MPKKRQSPKEQKKSRLSGRVVAFVVAVGAVSGALLFQTGKRSGEAPREALSPPVERPMRALAVGDALPIVPIFSLSGERLKLRAPAGSRPVLMFVFSPTCSVCSDTLPLWMELYEEAKAQSIEVLGLSVLDPARTAAYIRQRLVPWRVYCLAGKDAFDALGIQKVPLTLLLEPTGKVAVTVSGRIGEEDKQSLLRAIHADRSD